MLPRPNMFHRWDVAVTVGPLLAAAFGVLAPFASRAMREGEQFALRGGQCGAAANKTCGAATNCQNGLYQCGLACSQQLQGQACGFATIGLSPPQCVDNPNGGECAQGEQIRCTDQVTCMCGNYGTNSAPNWKCGSGNRTSLSQTYYCLSGP